MIYFEFRWTDVHGQEHCQLLPASSEELAKVAAEQFCLINGFNGSATTEIYTGVEV